MYLSEDANSSNYGEVCFPSTQRLVERSNHTPSWGCAGIAGSLQLSVRPFDSQGPQRLVDNTPMEPLSSFALWQIEEDQKFYAMFPEARPTNEWPSQSTPSDSLKSGELRLSSGAENWIHASHLATQLNTTIACTEGINSTTQSSLVLIHNTDTPSTDRTHEDYPNAPDSCNTHTIRPISFQHDCVIRRSSHNPTSPQHESIYSPQGISSSHDEYAQNDHVVSSSHLPHHIVPSQQRPILQRVVIPTQEPEPPLMDHLPSPTSSHSSLSPPALPQEPYINQGYSPRTYYPMEPSTYWPMYPQQQVPGLDPHFRHPAHAFVNTGWPLRPPSPRIRLSPLPSKRVLEKKPPLACLFCRGRKIACGPPEPGTTEKTCNQCQRRSIKCEYPSESRRGMRTKKTINNKVNIAGPKVKLGKGPKLKH
ncbi:hypothetical protein BDZ94DRAFT_1264049 [Collybia nuda]|uniref:Zn(2)-C6 fungal-type domain-containing protein n=1 Tax=Collybia nuda TaxID=64659 RepID=A0A9P5Y2T2_9AGAR|nr:hypothetical protein BDZ94DRAFT_1264049 [Collybia nuda]